MAEKVAVTACLWPTSVSPPWLLASTLLPFLQMNLPPLSEHHTQHTDIGKLLPDFIMLQCIQSDGHEILKIHLRKYIYTNAEDRLRMYGHNSVITPLRNKPKCGNGEQTVPRLKDFIRYIFTLQTQQ